MTGRPPKPTTSAGQTRASISYLPDSRAWLLGTGEFSYALAVDEAGFHVKHLYWGAAIGCRDVASLAADRRDWWSNEPDTLGMRQPGAQWRGFESAPRAFTEEVVARGGFRFDEPSLAVTLADRTTGLLLRYVGHQIVNEGDRAELTLTLRDERGGLRVDLHYLVCEGSSALTRWTSIHNEAGSSVDIERAASATWPLPSHREFKVRNFFGHVQGEFQLEENAVPHGTRRLGSRTGTSDHRGTPWIALHENATEDAGEVWSFALAYSGSWQISTQLSDDRGLHVVAGVGDEEMRCTLGPGEALQTPPSIGVHSDRGFAHLSHRWHEHVSNVIVPDRRRPLPVLYNTWFGFQFDVNNDALLSQARLAAEVGAEIFVIDDGWFGGRVDARHGLGSWTPDGRAFPRGMAAFRRSLNEFGMELGLWVEPEMCTPDSRVFQDHPEWLHGTEGRFWQTHRHQHVLDLGLAEVQEWVIAQVSGVVESSGCSYVVWDMNRPLPLGGPVADGSVRQRHADGLAAVLAALRDRHPRVTWQACSGGGGRSDLGILRSMSLTWISDNTDAHDRASMISAASQVLPIGTMVHWVTDMCSSNPLSDALQQTSSLATRFHTGMNGVLGISADLGRWSRDQLSQAAQLTARYKEIRHLVADGRLYRLPTSRDALAHAYIARDASEAAVIVVASRASFGESTLVVRLRGLDPDGVYSVEGQPTRSGRLLMRDGILLAGPESSSWLLAVRRQH